MSAQFRQPNTAVAPIRSAPEPSIASMPSITAGFTDLSSFELTLRVSKMLSSSTLAPREYQGPNGIANCAIALNMASRIGADPLLVMQNLVVIHGRPTWSAQFLVATFNSCGRFSPIRYEFEGKEGTNEWGCRATAIERASGEKLTGPLVTIGLAKQEGWYDRNGSKWKTMPEMMLRYRAAAWFVRTTAPELSMGLQTADEIHDAFDARQTPDGRYTVEAEPEPAEQVDIETGEISGASPNPEPEAASAPPDSPAHAQANAEPDPEQSGPARLSSAAADWMAHIETIDTKAQIGMAAKAIRESHDLTGSDRAELKELLRQQQDKINQKVDGAA